MIKARSILSAAAVAAILILANPAFAARQDKPAAAGADFTDVSARISQGSQADALKTAENALSGCKTYDDYEAFVTGIAKTLQGQAAKNPDILYLAAAKARLEQLAILSASNDIQAGRLYMSVSERYYNEASDYLEKCAAVTTSKDLPVEADILKFRIAAEKFQSDKLDSLLDRIAGRLVSYSDNPALNNEKLDQAAETLSRMGMAGYALKLKVAYMSKADKRSAEAVLEGIKKGADQEFAQGDPRSAAKLYDQYIKTGQGCFSKDVMAPKVMEIAEKYFAGGRFREARPYYEFYRREYPDSKVLDYCDYRIAVCFYNEKDMINAVQSLQAFLDAYKNSIWFDKAFETLSRLYYVNYSREDAVKNLQNIIDNYYRKNTGDYARVLMALLYYGDKQFDRAREELKKIEDASIYSYPASTLLDDIDQIKKKNTAPKFSIASKDTYKVWEPYSGPSLIVKASENGKAMEYTYADDVAHLSVSPGAVIKFDMQEAEDLDKFGEYLQDKDDISRLPKQVKEDTEKDLMSLEWSSADGGKFADDKQSKAKSWQAPATPGSYKICARLEDFGLVRAPDKGSRKDSTKEFDIIVDVK